MIKYKVMDSWKKNELFPCEITGWSSDGAGVTRGLSQAAASGVYAARTILGRMGGE